MSACRCWLVRLRTCARALLSLLMQIDHCHAQNGQHFTLNPWHGFAHYWWAFQTYFPFSFFLLLPWSFPGFPQEIFLSSFLCYSFTSFLDFPKIFLHLAFHNLPKIYLFSSLPLLFFLYLSLICPIMCFCIFVKQIGIFNLTKLMKIHLHGQFWMLVRILL